MANTLIPIQTVTLSSSASVVGFYNIPQNYTDLKVVISTRNVANSIAGNVYIKPNGSSANMASKNLYGYGTGNGSNTDVYCWGYCNANNSTASNFSNLEFNIPNYTSITSYKSLYCDSIFEHNGTEGRQAFTNGLWSSNSAITYLEFITRDNGNVGADSTFVANSTFTLYGISNGVKATGGTLTVAGGYAYHTFTSSSTFIPSQQIIGAEALVVAGGGGGCGYGAGGAGGLSYRAPYTLTIGSYPVVVGSGGASAGSSGGAAGGTGTDSNFAGITSSGGGGGRTANTGLSGGSGAGGSYSNNAGGSATQGNTGGAIGYGNAGGAGYTDNSTIFNAGGGGGAGAAGTAGTISPTNGGIGLGNWATWATATGTGDRGYYAGGGSGSSRATTNYPVGGIGGGGAGGNRNVSAAGGDATANTGGGGGSGDDTQGGTGGSGIVIIRYPLA